MWILECIVVLFLLERAPVLNKFLLLLVEGAMFLPMPPFLHSYLYLLIVVNDFINEIVK